MASQGHPNQLVEQKMSARTSRYRSFSLLATAACIVIACAGKNDMSPVDVEKQAFEDLRSEMREAIDDPAREAEAIALLDVLINNLDVLREKVTERKEQARQLNASYDTSRAEFEAHFDRIDKEIQSSHQRVSRSHHALIVITTPEEWGAISKARSKAMSAAITSLQAG